MRTLYGEDILLINFCVNYVMLVSVYIARHQKISFARAAVAAVCGALYALAAYGISEFLFGLFFKFVSCVAMGLILSKKPRAKEALLNACLILMASFSCAGATMFISFLTSGLSAIFAPLKVTSAMLFIGAVSGSMISAFAYDRAFYRFEPIERCEAIIACGSKKAKAVMLNDSGNLLRTISGHSISLLEESIFLSLTGLASSTIGSFDEFEEEFGKMDSFQKERCSLAVVESANSSSLQIVFKADSIEFESGLKASPAFISGAKNLSSAEFKGIFNHKLLLLRG